MKKVFTLGVVLTTILWTMGVAAFVPVASAATLAAGDLIKASGPAVYFYAADGKRYTFPTEKTYLTWYSGFSVKTITDNELAAIDLAGNVVVRPGTNLVKITTVPKVFAVEPNGKLAWVKTEAAAKALYGTDWAKKVIDIPDGFWTNYVNSGKELDGTAYPTGQLVKWSGSADVYYVNADGTKSKVTAAGMTENNFRTAYVVTAPASISMTSGADVTGRVATLVDASQGGGAGNVVTTSIRVALSPSTPAANYVSKGVQNALYAKYDFSGTGTVSKIVLQRKGLGFDADIDAVRLYDGATQIGTDQSLNTSTHQVTFNNLNWAVSGTKTLSVKANVNSSAAGTNDYFELVQVVDGAGASQTLAIAGNAMQISAVTAGNLNVTAVAGSAAVISGATDQELGCWNLVSSSTEGFYIDSIKLTNVGSASSIDAKNFVLKVSPNVLPGSQVSSMASNNTVTFSLSTPYVLEKSQTKKLCVYGDIASGITVSKTVIFQVADSKDVAVRGDSSGGQVLITYNANNGGTDYDTFTAQSSKTNTIGQGTATLAQDSGYAPTTGTAFVKGVAGNKMGAYKLTAGSTEGVKLTKLVYTLKGTNVANTDFSNWSLYKIVDGAEVAIPVSGTVSGLTITFEDTSTGLLDVPKGENRSFVVKADVSTSVGGNESSVLIYLDPNNDDANETTNTVAKIKGLGSGDYITSGVTLSAVEENDAQTFTIGSNGALTISKASTSPAATTVAKGTTKVHFTSINLYATGEDVEVTDLVLTATEDVNDGDTLADTGDISNVYITDENGVQLGTTVTNPSSGEFSFSFSYTVPKDANKVIKVYGDVPSASGSGTLHVDMDTDNTDITSKGSYSQTTLTESGTAVGSTMVVGTPSFTGVMLGTPLASNYVVNATGLTVGKLMLTAGTSEAIKVTSIKITADDANTINGASAAAASVRNVRLLDASNHEIQYGITQNLTEGGGNAVDYVTFSGINNLTLAAGASKTLDIVLDATAAAGPFYFGVADPDSEMTGTGLSSNTAASALPVNTDLVSLGATITAKGTLKVNKAADMPVAAQLVSGSTGNTVMKYKLEAVDENIDITVLPIYFEGVPANVANFKLYKDGVLIGDPAGYSFGYSAAGILNTVNFTAGTFVVVKDVPTYLTIKMDLNPKAQVTTSATGYQIGIADSNGDNSEGNGAGGAGSYSITAKGVASGSTISPTDIDSVGDGSGNVYASNDFTFHKGILTVSKNASSPSGTSIAGSNQEVLRLDMTAVGDDIAVDEMEFCVSGSATDINGTGDVTLKNSDGSVTYATMTAATFDGYWDDEGGDGSNAGTYYPMDPGNDLEYCFSLGVKGETGVDKYSADEDISPGGANLAKTTEEFTTQITVSAGETKVIKLYGDTTSAATNKTLQISLKPHGTAANAATVSGLSYEDSSGTTVDLTTTKNLPVTGGSLLF